MNKKITIGLLLLAVALVGTPVALSLPSYATALQSTYGSGLSCGTCHVDPNGGGARNAYGQLFEAVSTHSSDPTGALCSIGAPAGATTNNCPTTTPTPTPTSTPVLTTINVSPATATLDVNGTQAFTATAYDQLGKLMDVIFSWNSSNTTVGTIDSTGLFTAKAPGTTTITAASGDVNGTASVSVSAAPTSSPPSSSPCGENHGNKYGKIHKHKHSTIHENGCNGVNETEHDEVEEDD